MYLILTAAPTDLDLALAGQGYLMMMMLVVVGLGLVGVRSFSIETLVYYRNS